MIKNVEYKFYKAWRDSIAGDKWFEVSEKDVIKNTEENGYYKSGSVIDILSTGYIIRTPAARFKMEKEVMP